MILFVRGHKNCEGGTVTLEALEVEVRTVVVLLVFLLLSSGLAVLAFRSMPFFLAQYLIFHCSVLLETRLHALREFPVTGQYSFASK
mmetsp:Transcript_23126/g.40680  ORF Transcript_23126/g.40680 Transcript_23126/m.40680 type:complete len:87 (+) Transcript_23126:575-835(+)